MSKIKIAFVGTGSMGQCAHLRNYVIEPDCEVVALAELRPGLAKRVGERYGVGKVYGTHAELLKKEKPDGIVAIQQFQAHGKLIPELFSAGVPILIEKPLARSVEAGKAIIAAAAKSKARLYAAYHKRSDPATVYARKLIDQWKESGQMGRMRYVRVTMPPGSWDVAGFSTMLRSDEPYPALEVDAPAAGMDEAAAKAYDSFVNFYIHQVNLLRHLLGENYRVSYADPSKVLLVGHSDSGVTCCLEMAPYKTTLDWQETALVGFDKGWIKLELPAPLAVDRPGQVAVFADAGPAEPQMIVPQFPWVHAMRQQARNFIKAVKGEATPLCTAEEALADLEIAKQYIKMLGDNPESATSPGTRVVPNVKAGGPAAASKEKKGKKS